MGIGDYDTPKPDVEHIFMIEESALAVVGSEVSSTWTDLVLFYSCYLRLGWQHLDVMAVCPIFVHHDEGYSNGEYIGYTNDQCDSACGQCSEHAETSTGSLLTFHVARRAIPPQAIM